MTKYALHHSDQKQSGPSRYIFLTMTYNPKWLKINNALLPGQSIVDRPDLVARVFCIKLCALMDFVTDEKDFL